MHLSADHLILSFVSIQRLALHPGAKFVWKFARECAKMQSACLSPALERKPLIELGGLVAAVEDHIELSEKVVGTERILIPHLHVEGERRLHVVAVQR